MSSRFAFRRVVIGFGAASGPGMSLDVAARLARIARAELKGLFVEESALLDLADLPFSQIVARGARTPRGLERAELQKAFSERSRAFRRALSLQADQLRLSWEFASLRGDLLALLAEECRREDIVVLAGYSASVTVLDLIITARKLSGNVAGVLIAAGERDRRRGPVVAVDEGGEAGRHVVEMAEEIARNAARPLVLISRGAPERELPAGAAVQVVHVDEAAPADIARAVGRIRPWCVLGDMTGQLFGENASARALISAAAAPVLLLQEKQAPAALPASAGN